MKEEGKKRNPQEKKERETFRQRDVGWRYSHWFGNGGSLETSAKSWERLRFCQCQTEGRRTSESWDVCEKLRKTQILSVSNWGRADFRVSRQSWRKPWRGTVSGLCVWNLCWLLSLFVMYKFVICLGTGCSGARFKPCVCVCCILYRVFYVSDSAGEEVTLYTWGKRDVFSVFFYFLICVVIHAVIQEYILDVSFPLLLMQ